MTARGREGRLHRRFWRLRLPPRRLLPRPPSVASSGVIAWHGGARGRQEARHPGTTHGRGDVCEGVKGGEEVLGAAVCLLQLLRRRSRRITRLLLHRCAPLARVAALVPALACQGRQRAGREVHRPRWRRVCSWQAAPCLLPCLPPPPSSSLAGVSTAAALSSDATAAGGSTVGGVTSVVEMVEAAGSAAGVASSASSLLPPRRLPLPRRPCQRCQRRALGRCKRLANTAAHGGERGEPRAALSVC